MEALWLRRGKMPASQLRDPCLQSCVQTPWRGCDVALLQAVVPFHLFLVNWCQGWCGLVSWCVKPKSLLLVTARELYFRFYNWTPNILSPNRTLWRMQHCIISYVLPFHNYYVISILQCVFCLFGWLFLYLASNSPSYPCQAGTYNSELNSHLLQCVLNVFLH